VNLIAVDPLRSLTDFVSAGATIPNYAKTPQYLIRAHLCKHPVPKHFNSYIVEVKISLPPSPLSWKVLCYVLLFLDVSGTISIGVPESFEWGSEMGKPLPSLR
jgi:hypothetical protein